MEPTPRSGNAFFTSSSISDEFDKTAMPNIPSVPSGLERGYLIFKDLQDKGKFATLDEVTTNTGLAAALVIPETDRQSPSKLTCKLVQLGWLNTDIPEGHSITKGGRISNYVNPEVVGETVALTNTRLWFERERAKGEFKTLDDVTQNIGLASALGVHETDRRSPSKLASKLVQLGWLSAEIPEGHSVSAEGGISNYVNPDVVGETVALNNVKLWFERERAKGEFKTLDEVTQYRGLASALRVPEFDRQSPLKLATKLVQLGWLSAEIPAGHSITKGNIISNYVNPDVVGETVALNNVKLWFERERAKGEFATLDEVTLNNALASAIGVPLKDRSSPPKLAAKLVQLGWLSAGIPEGHSITKGGGVSNYVNPDVVGETVALSNVKLWFERERARGECKTLDEVTQNMGLASALRFPESDRQSPLKLATKLVQLGWLRAEIPEGHSITKGGGVSNYVNPDVVGETVALNNVKLWFERERAKGEFKTLDEVTQNRGLASALRVPEFDRKSPLKLATKLVQLGWLSAEIPAGHSITKGNIISNYVNPDVVGETVALNNVKLWFERERAKGEFATLDEVTLNNALASAIGVPLKDRRSSPKLAAKLVQLGWLRAEIPEGHSISAVGGISNYVNREVVGEAVALNNVKLWFERERAKGEFKTLDDLTKNFGLASALGITLSDRHSPVSLAAKLVQLGWLRAEIPEGHSISKKGGISNYLNPEVVGETDALNNVKLWFERERAKGEFATLDEVTQNNGLASALGVPLSERQSSLKLASKLVQLGWLSAEIPEGHSISKPGGISIYVNRKVVGEEVALANIKRWVQERFTSSEEIRKDSLSFYSLCSALKIPKSSTELKAALTKLDCFLPADESHGETSLPKEFVRHEIEKRSKNARSTERLRNLKAERELGVESVKDPKLEATFAKGEAFEQLVGLSLGFTMPNEQLWGQYCLKVDSDSGFFGVRADWKIGGRIIEVKWGGAASNIEETYAKHQKLIPDGMSYQVIVLKRNGPLNVPVTTFDEVTGGDSRFTEIANILEDVSLESSSEDQLKRLKLFRDALYSFNVEQNNIFGEARKAKIDKLLNTFIAGEGPIEERLAALATRRFPGLAAVFEHDGKIYRGTISIPAYQEETKRFKLFWRLGYDLLFEHAEDRDLALLLECSEEFYKEKRTVYDALRIQEKSGERYTFENPKFLLPSGKYLSGKYGDGDVKLTTPEEVINHLTIDPSLFQFVKEYITECGAMA